MRIICFSNYVVFHPFYFLRVIYRFSWAIIIFSQLFAGYFLLSCSLWCLRWIGAWVPNAFGLNMGRVIISYFYGLLGFKFTHLGTYTYICFFLASTSASSRATIQPALPRSAPSAHTHISSLELYQVVYCLRVINKGSKLLMGLHTFVC